MLVKRKIYFEKQVRRKNSKKVCQTTEITRYKIWWAPIMTY